MNREIQTVGIGEVFLPVSRSGDIDFQIFGKNIVGRFELNIAELGRRSSIPFVVGLNSGVKDDRSGLLHRLHVESDRKRLTQRQLIEVRERDFLGLKWQKGLFFPEVLAVAQRLRLHLMRPEGRLEHEPDEEALKKGAIEFSPRPAVEDTGALVMVRWRFILAD
ncbi:MAG: hypothetical protein M1324_00420 [Patescibacteria group bacterium]|nr:hypothetical protein [Patescibacteria group bacterium]